LYCSAHSFLTCALSPDARRFLMTRNLNVYRLRSSELVVVQNCVEELKRRVVGSRYSSSRKGAVVHRQSVARHLAALPVCPQVERGDDDGKQSDSAEQDVNARQGSSLLARTTAQQTSRIQSAVPKAASGNEEVQSLRN
jgi:hypothetical protein